MIAYLLGLVAGVATPTQTSVNLKLREKVRSPFTASVISFATATVLLVIILLLSGQDLSLPLGKVAENPWWIWIGGMCGTGIVVLNVICLPHLGSAMTVMLLSFGQIMTGLIVDNWGLFGSPQFPMTVTRAIGAVFVIAGVVLVSGSRGKTGDKQKYSPIYIIMAILGGVCCATQVAVNGTLGTVVGSGIKGTLISMLVGTVFTVLVTVAAYFIQGKDRFFDKTDGDVPFSPIMLTGGVFAVIIVGSNVITAPILGAGLVTVMNLIGQMSMGLVIDAVGFLGIEKKPVTLVKLLGVISMIGGTAVIMLL